MIDIHVWELGLAHEMQTKHVFLFLPNCRATGTSNEQVGRGLKRRIDI